MNPQQASKHPTLRLACLTVSAATLNLKPSWLVPSAVRIPESVPGRRKRALKQKKPSSSLNPCTHVVSAILFANLEDLVPYANVSLRVGVLRLWVWMCGLGRILDLTYSLHCSSFFLV